MKMNKNNEKKLKFWLFSIIILSIFGITLKSNYAVDDVKISNSLGDIFVQYVSQNPMPAKPNDIVNLKFMISNYGNKYHEDIAIEIIPEEPFKKYGTTLKFINLLMPYQKDNFAQLIDFDLFVTENALSGDYKLKIRIYKISSPSTYLERTINVKVENEQVVFNLYNLTIFPSKIKPGDQGRLEFVLKNDGISTAKDVEIELSLPNGLSVLNGANTYSIRELKKDSSVGITYNIFADSINPGIYKGTINVKYKVGNNNQVITKSFSIGFVVDVESNVDSYVIYSNFKNGVTDVSINVINLGNSPIKFVNAKLLESSDYTIVSGNSYLASIDSSDYDSMDFKIRTDKEKVLLKYEISWRDYYNKQYSRIFEKEIKINIPKENVKEKNKQMEYAFWLGIILVTIFWIFMFVDALQNKRENKVKKWIWVVVVIATLPLGALLYYLFGRNKED
ncbi:MAG: PLDc N-terminal domain-containing protein [Candidatus Woesearchaeota archaeon]